MNFNPMSILSMVQAGGNPQQLMLNMLEKQMQGSPMGANLINLAKNNRTEEIEQIVRNLCSQRGMDFDKEFNSFRKSLGI